MGTISFITSDEITNIYNIFKEYCVIMNCVIGTIFVECGIIITYYLLYELSLDRCE